MSAPGWVRLGADGFFAFRFIESVMASVEHRESMATQRGLGMGDSAAGQVV